MFGQSHKIERRLRPRRLLVNPPIYVSVDESSTALLFDLGEGGLSVYGLVPKKRAEVFPVAFDLPVGGGSILIRKYIRRPDSAVPGRGFLLHLGFARAKRWTGREASVTADSAPVDPGV
jgi:hypothetical protein